MNTDAPGVLYVGGNFTNAGGKANADFIASWNGTAWSAVGPGLNGGVRAIAYQAGKVYVGGVFTNAGGNANADFLAVWDGVSWAPFCNATGAAFTASVNALQIIGPTLYVGGAFQNGADIASADSMLACDLNNGAPRSPFAAEGDGTGNVLTLTADSNGVLYAGGSFLNLADDPDADDLASLDSSGWHSVGSTPISGFVRSLTARGTDVYVGTDAADIAGIQKADHVAKWNGSSFSGMGSNTAGTNGWFPTSTFIYGMTTFGSLVFATGSFQNANGDPLADNVAYFDGTAWHPLGSDGAGNGPWSGDGSVLSTFQQQIYAGGGFTSAGGDTNARFAASYPASYPTPRPDARIGTNSAGPFVGNGVNNATGSGQSRTVSVARGHSGTFFVNIQNDGLLAGSFTVTGTGAARGFTVTYFRGATNVTSQVKNGTYSTGSLAPGSSRTLKMVVKLSASSANAGSFLITAKTPSGASSDTVKATVRAT